MSAQPLGTQMAREIAEQPEVLRRLANDFEAIGREVRVVARAKVRGVALLARGSSDNAALLARYAVELYTGLPTCLVAPSLVTVYGRRPDCFADWLLVALSQSGRTPEIVRIAADFRQAGAPVVGITNEPASELGQVADLAIGLGAGLEVAVPATKTVTSQMLAVLAIASGLSAEGLSGSQARELPDAVSALLSEDAAVRDVAAAIARCDRLAVVGRGPCYPASLETALKVQETSGVMAHGFSSADFRHGPIAVCGSGSPAVLLAGSGAADADTRSLVPELVLRDTATFVVGNGAGAVAGWAPLGNPAEAILATVRGQQLAHVVATTRGVDPDAPSGLNKVTLTQ